jgi:hypothetical protein
VKSSDGIKWSSPQTVIDWDLSNYELMLSPSVVRMSDNLYYLWMTNGYDAAFRYTSTDGINWTAREQINTPDYAWHMNVKYIPEKSEYWMLYNYPAQHGMLKFARSTDGMNWTTYPNAVMMSSTSGWDTNLYRSTFVYDNTTSQFKIWYSAYTDEQIWHIGYVNKTYSDMLNALSAPSGWTKWNGLGFWMTSSDIKKRGTYSGKLIQLSGYENNQMIIHKDAPFQNNFYEECDMYDDLASDAFKMFRIHGDGEVGLGVYSGSSNDYYSFHSNSYEYTNTNQKRTLGWHKFGILLKADSSVAFFIDGINVGTLSSQFNDATAISIEGLSLQPSTFYIDDIRVRKYADSEPSLNSFGAETAK